MQHKSHDEMIAELEAAKTKVKVGGIYSHFKDPNHLVKVIAIGVQEATDKLCVIYHEIGKENVIFARDLDIWLEKPIKDTPRFRLVE